MTTEPTQSTKDVAADQAKDVAAEAKANAADVAGTAKEQGQALLSETRSHARGLLTQARSELSDQAGTQQGRLGDVLRSLAVELQEMAGASESTGGVAAGLVGDVAGRADDAARWLEQRTPEDVLSEMRAFARRKPGTFLAAAAAVGFIGGRLTRGLTAQDDEPRALTASPYGYATTPYEAPAGVQAHGYGRVDATDGADVAGTTHLGVTADEPFDQYAAQHRTPVEYVEQPDVVTFEDDRGQGRDELR